MHVPNTMCQSQIFVRLFLCLEGVRPCLYDLCTRPHGEQLHTTWPPRMRIVPFFRLRNTVKNFIKRGMEISLTLSKTVLLLLKRQYVRMSPNPVYFPSTQRLTTSQRHWNLFLFNNIPAVWISFSMVYITSNQLVKFSSDNSVTFNDISFAAGVWNYTDDLNEHIREVTKKWSGI